MNPYEPHQRDVIGVSASFLKHLVNPQSPQVFGGSGCFVNPLHHKAFMNTSTEPWSGVGYGVGWGGKGGWGGRDSKDNPKIAAVVDKIFTR